MIFSKKPTVRLQETETETESDFTALLTMQAGHISLINLQSTLFPDRCFTITSSAAMPHSRLKNVDISGLDKAEVLMVLYNGCKSDHQPSMGKSAAKQILSLSSGIISTINKRPFNMSFNGNSISCETMDGAVRPGYTTQTIFNLRVNGVERKRNSCTIL